MAATCVKHVNVSGVASKEIRDVLRSMPVTTLQGSYYSAPVTKAEFLAAELLGK